MMLTPPHAPTCCSQPAILPLAVRKGKARVGFESWRCIPLGCGGGGCTVPSQGEGRVESTHILGGGSFLLSHCIQQQGCKLGLHWTKLNLSKKVPTGRPPRGGLMAWLWTGV